MNNDNTIVGTVKMMALLFIVIALSGVVAVLVWTIIKIPLWLISPWRGGYETTRHGVMRISFRRMMWTPYTWPMIWASGWGGLFAAMIYFAIGNPESPVWTDPYMFYALIAIGAMGYLVAIYCMVCEAIMIFNFEGWFHKMRELGHNPLA